MKSFRVAYVLLLLVPSVAFGDEFKRGVAALKKKDYDLAIRCFTAHIRDNPKDPDGYLQRGTAYFWKGEDDKAIKDLSECLRLDPRRATGYRNRGLAYSQKKEHDKAVKDFTRAIRLDPKDPRSYQGRGHAHAMKKEYAKAAKDFAQAVRLTPRGEVSSTLAWVAGFTASFAECDNFNAAVAAGYAECGDFEQAVSWQKKAIELGFANKKHAEKARQRLKLYEKGKPYRDN
jgi:tetratricopeptide (TPR) repeat protein